MTVALEMLVPSFDGGCHCDNLAYTWDATQPLELLGLRACQCSFCRAHSARNASDPRGAVRIELRTGGKLVRYRFGLRTADFLLCGDCGVYIGALLPDGDRGWFTANVNTFAEPPALDFPLQPIVYDSEDVAGRVDRRRTKWTPVMSFRE